MIDSAKLKLGFPQIKGFGRYDHQRSYIIMNELGSSLLTNIDTHQSEFNIYAISNIA